MSIKLNNVSLESLPKGTRKPNYNRQDLSVGIVHVGVGNFHRAHQAMYLHRLFEMGEDHNWAICGAGIKSYDQQMRDKLHNQDWLTTVVELEQDKIEAHICASMVDFTQIDADILASKMAEPTIKIVSLTITEGGYYICQDSGEFDLGHPDIEADVANIDSPRTVFGILLKALKIRQTQGIKAFTIMSCDNVPHNGDVTKKAVLGLANAVDTDFAKWIEHRVCFPNSMVDCIAPQVSDDQRERVEALFGLEDAAPVMCESFRQWVLEDKFSNGRPALEKVGVQFVPDVAPYELMKLRILNGSHAALAYPSGLLGIEFVHDAMKNQLITQYLAKLVHDEAIPSLPNVPGIDLNEYHQVIVERFSNPEIEDTIERLYQDGENRLPKFILPTILDNLASGVSIQGSVLVLALWCKVLQQSTAKNSRITLSNSADEIHIQKALAANEDLCVFAQMTDVFGELSENQQFVDTFAKWLTKLNDIGVEFTLKHYLASQ